VTLSDVLPPDTQFVGITTSPGWSCIVPAIGSTGTLTCQLSRLSTNASATLDIVVKVVAPGKTTITNVVSITGSSPDPNAINNSATVTTRTFGRA
jgi:hypothetical protein